MIGLVLIAVSFIFGPARYHHGLPFVFGVMIGMVFVFSQSILKWVQTSMVVYGFAPMGRHCIAHCDLLGGWDFLLSRVK